MCWPCALWNAAALLLCALCPLHLPRVHDMSHVPEQPAAARRGCGPVYLPRKPCGTPGSVLPDPGTLPWPHPGCVLCPRGSALSGAVRSRLPGFPAGRPAAWNFPARCGPVGRFVTHVRVQPSPCNPPGSCKMVDMLPADAPSPLHHVLAVGHTPAVHSGLVAVQPAARRCCIIPCPGPGPPRPRDPSRIPEGVIVPRVLPTCYMQCAWMQGGPPLTHQGTVRSAPCLNSGGSEASGPLSGPVDPYPMW